MKAAVYYETGPPEVLRYEDVPDPACPPGFVVIDTHAVSIEGGDTLNRSGGEMASKPHIVGYQSAGVIREVGQGVTDREVGQRVVTMMAFGSHAAQRAVPAAYAFPVPDGLDLEHAAAVPIPFGTAHDCLFEYGRLAAGETVLVQAGGGAVGLAAIQLAKRAGAIVITTAGSDEKLTKLAPGGVLGDLGCDHGINYRENDFVEAVGQITGGKGADLAVDSIGGSTLQGSIRSVGYRGRVITVGRAGREDVQPDVWMLSEGNKCLTGVSLALDSVVQPARVQPMITKLLGDVAKGELRVVLDRTFRLAEAAEAHRYIESRAALGRVLLIP